MFLYWSVNKELYFNLGESIWFTADWPPAWPRAAQFLIYLHFNSKIILVLFPYESTYYDDCIKPQFQSRIVSFSGASLSAPNWNRGEAQEEKARSSRKWITMERQSFWVCFDKIYPPLIKQTGAQRQTIGKQSLLLGAVNSIQPATSRVIFPAIHQFRSIFVFTASLRWKLQRDF